MREANANAGLCIKRIYHCILKARVPGNEANDLVAEMAARIRTQDDLRVRTKVGSLS